MKSKTAFSSHASSLKRRSCGSGSTAGSASPPIMRWAAVFQSFM